MMLPTARLIRTYRLYRGLTQESFAEEYHVSVSAVKCWETSRRVPRIDYLLRLKEDARSRGILDLDDAEFNFIKLFKDAICFVYENKIDK